MAIARVQVAKAEFNAGTAKITVHFSSATTTGNLIAVIIRQTNASGVVLSIGDGTNTYTLAGSNITQDPSMFGYYAKNITGTASDIVIDTFPNGSAFQWGYAIEYSGADTTAPLDTHDEHTGTGVTDCVTGSVTTTAAGVIVLGISQPAFTTYTAGTNFSLVDGSIGTGPYGGVEEWITSGSQSAVMHITSGVTNQYTTALMAFKAAGGGATFNPGWATGATRGVLGTGVY